MRLIRRVFLAVSVLVLVGGLAAAATLPGPQRILCPTCFGLEQIAPRVYVDTEYTGKQRGVILQAIATARGRVRDFFGELKSDPQIVVCRTRACRHTFGSRGAKGVAYGWQAVLLTNSRIFDVIATHELMHIELHWRMGVVGWVRGTVPAWFDEGLATVVSNDPRFKRDASSRAVRQIVDITSYWGQWSQHARKVGWRTAYSASATRVRQLERKIGRSGLRRFVDRLVHEGDLPALLALAERGHAF